MDNASRNVEPDEPVSIDAPGIPARLDRAEFIRRVQSKPSALETSWEFHDDGGQPLPLRFPTGALSIIAAATGHGKTMFLTNLMVDMARRYPSHQHWLFSYEEGAGAIIVKTLNSFIDMTLSDNNRKWIEDYYRTVGSSDQGDPPEEFAAKEKEFWELVDRRTINIVEYGESEKRLGEVITSLGPKTGLVAIDYLGLLQLEKRDAGMSRQEELKRISIALKDVAIKTKLAIVAAAQFNREVASRSAMALRRIADASDIERTANKVLGLWCNEKPTENSGSADSKRTPRLPATITIEVLKARDERSGLSGNYQFDGNRGTIGRKPIEVPNRIATTTSAGSANNGAEGNDFAESSTRRKRKD